MKRSVTLKGHGDKTPFEIYGHFRPAPMYLYERGKYLSADAKLVYIVLISFKRDANGLCCPSYESLMERTSLSRDRLRKALNELDRFGWIKRMNIVGSSNHYEVVQPPVRKLRFEIGDRKTWGDHNTVILDGKEIVDNLRYDVRQSEIDALNTITPLKLEATRYAKLIRSNRTAKRRRRRLKLVA